MKLPGIKLNKSEPGVSLSHAFGASGQTQEEILGSTYAPPAGPTAAEKAGALFSGLKDKAAGLASKVHIPNPGLRQQSPEAAPEAFPPEAYAPDGFVPEGYAAPEGAVPYGQPMTPPPPADGWYNPFTDPEPPRYPSVPAGYGYAPAYTPDYMPPYAPQDYAYAPGAAAYAPDYAAPAPAYIPEPQEPVYAPEAAASAPGESPAGVPADAQPIFNMEGEVIGYAPPYYDAAGNLLGYAQPCFDANGNLVGFAPPAVVGQPAAAKTPADAAVKAAPGRSLKDWQYGLWAASIGLGMVLTLISFVYACIL